MKTTLIFLMGISLLFPVTATGQTMQQPLSSASTGVGTYSLRHTDIFSAVTNKAALAQLKSTAAGVYGERRFLLNELSNYIAVIGVPTRSGNFGLEAHYAGSTDYNEKMIGLAYARKLGNKADIGAQFNYTGFRLSGGYGSASAISFEIGSVLHLTERLHAGLQVSNPLGGKWGSTKEEKLSSVYTLGFGYDASDKFVCTAIIEKQENQPVNVQAGLQYRFIPQVLVKAGMSTAASSGWFGIGLLIKKIRVELISNFHPQLGVTPGLLLLFNFKNPNP
ncbi:MAG: hypothetical protein JNM19_11695 [Chitinophagaceae bacterium]|nr:hypothetical protein [Chitinophagaceae bacterium]